MIKNFKLFESHDDIHSICREYYIGNYNINDDGSIDSNRSVALHGRNLKKIPLKFRNVAGYFDCYNNQLASLEGSPINIGTWFNCRNSQLISLEGCAQNIGGSFDCSYNQLTSLKYGPKNVGGHFNCENNKIRSLEGFPENLVGRFNGYYNPINTLINSWINKPNRDTMVEYFNDLDIIRDNGKSIILDRLEEFIDIYNVEINLELVEEHYKII